MPRIAVIEDNSDNRFLMQVLLEDRYELDMYESGLEALAKMRACIPDLALIDISLPGMDGTEVLQWMRTTSELTAVPAVALTAHAMAGDREKYLGLGFDGYLSKPINDEEQLQQVIARLLSSQAA